LNRLFDAMGEALRQPVLAPEMTCAAKMADAHFRFNGELRSDRLRYIDDDKGNALVLPFPSPSAPDAWDFFTPFGAFRQTIRFPASGEGDPFVVVLPSTEKVRVQPFWNHGLTT